MQLQQEQQQRQQESAVKKECSGCVEYKAQLMNARSNFTSEKNQAELKLAAAEAALNEKTEQVRQLKQAAAQKCQEWELERKLLMKQLEAAHHRVEDLTNRVALTLLTFLYGHLPHLTLTIVFKNIL